MDQEELRNKLNKYLQSTGVKARWLAGKLDIHESRISHFRRGREVLSEKDFVKLNEFLVDKGMG